MDWLVAFDPLTPGDDAGASRKVKFLNPLGTIRAACREFIIPAEAGIPPMAGLDSVSSTE